MKVLFIMRQSPYGGTLAREALDAALAMAAFDKETLILFSGDGVFQLLGNQDSKATHRKSIEKILSALELYDINRVYVDREDLDKRKIPAENLHNKAESLDKEDILTLISECDRVVSF